ncbi:MAG: autotransporter-associated beta strand repeat-containing protein [Verrucomicrobiota bacterium]
MKKNVNSGGQADCDSKMTSAALRLLPLLLFGMALSAHAQKVWTNAVVTKGLWSTVGNWSPNAAPVATDNLLFTNNAAQSAAQKNATNDIYPFISSLGSITFGTMSTNFNLYGTNLYLTGGITNLAGANTITLPITLSANQAWTNSGGTLTIGGAITNNSYTLTNVGAGAYTYNSVISGTGGFVSGGNGGTVSITFAAANTYQGATMITNIGSATKGNRLVVNTGASVGSNIVVVGASNELWMAGGKITNDVYISGSALGVDNHGAIRFSAGGAVSNVIMTGNSTIEATGSGDTGTIYGNISGAYTLTINPNGNGTVTNAGNSTFTGNVTIGGANTGASGLAIKTSGGLGVGPKTVTIAGNAPYRCLILDNSGTGADINLPTNISFTTSQPQGAITNIAGSNTINGNFTLTSGGGGTALIVLGGSLTMNGTFSANTTLRSLQLGGSMVGTVNGTIYDGTAPMGLIKQDTGVWTLNGTNLYTGPTVINANAGRLVLGSTGSISNSASITVNAGSIFDVAALNGTFTLNQNQILAGGGVVTGAVSVANNAWLEPGGVGVVGSMIITNGSLTNLAGSVMAVEIGGATCDQVLVDGSVAYTGTNYLYLSFLTAPPSYPYTYTVLQCKGTITGAENIGIISDYPATVAAVGNQLQVTIGGAGTPSTLVWQGGNYPLGTNAWIMGMVPAWTNPASAGAFIFNNNIAVFDDTGTSATVNVAGPVAPAWMTNNSSTINYTLQSVVGPQTYGIGGNGGLVKNGSSTLTVTMGNTYAGDTVVSQGTYKIGIAGAIPNGAGKGNVTVDGRLDVNGLSSTINGLNGGGTVDNVTNTATTTLTVGNGSSNGTFYGTLINSTSGLVAFTKTGTGIQTLAGNNLMRGAVTVNGGALVLSGSNAFVNGVTINNAGSLLTVGNVYALGATTNALVVNNGILDLAGYSVMVGKLGGTAGAISNSVSGTPSTLAFQPNGAVGANIRGNVNLLELAPTFGQSAWATFNTTNDFTGWIQINSGAMFSCYNTNCLGSSAGSITNSGQLELKTTPATTVTYPYKQLTMNNGGTIIGNTASGTTGNNWLGPIYLAGGNAYFNPGGAGGLNLLGAVSGPGNFINNVNALTTLPGTNIYTGNTLINLGRVALGITGSISNSPLISVASGAIFDVTQVSGGFALNGTVNQTLSGSGVVTGSVTVGTSAILAPGPVGAAGRLIVTNGSVTFAADSYLNLDLANVTNAANNDLLVVNGNLTSQGTMTANVSFLNGGPDVVANHAYTIITASGTIDPAFVGNLKVATRYGCTVAQLGNSITLTFDASGVINSNVVWQGDLTSNTNWANGTMGVTNLAGDGTMDFFYNGDNIVFDDTAPNVVVNLPGIVSPATININTTSNYTFVGSGKISGSTGLNKSGTGALTLANTGSNDFTGPITLGGGSLVISRSDTSVMGQAITGTGGNLVKAGSGTLILGGANNYTGYTTNLQGILQGTTTNFSGPNVILSGATNVISQSVTGVVAAPVSGNGTLVFGGSGTIIVTNANSLSGMTIVNSSAINALTPQVIFSNTSPGYAVSGDLRVGNISVGGSSFNCIHMGATNQIAPSSVISFDSASGKYGYIKFMGYDQQAAGLSDVTANGVVESTEDETVNPNTTLTLAGSGNYTFNGYLRSRHAGTGTTLLTLAKTGSGIQSLVGGNIVGAYVPFSASVANGQLVFSNTTAASAVDVVITNAGQVVMAGPSVLGNVSNALANGLIFSNTIANTIGGLDGSGNVALLNETNGAVALTVGSRNFTNVYSGALSGSGKFIKAGTGPMTLSGANTHSGGTSNSAAGALLLGADNVLGTGLLGLANGKLSSDGASARAFANDVFITGNLQLGEVAATGLTGDLSSSGGVNLAGAARTLTVSNITATFSGAVTNGGFTKNGDGTLVLSGVTNGLGSGVTVNGGRLILNGQTGLGAGTMTLGSATVDRPVTVINNDAIMAKLLVGNATGSVGVVVQNSGAVSVGAATGSADILSLGLNHGYGYYRLNSGSITAGQLALGGSVGGAGNTAVFDQFGGTVNVSAANGWLLWGWKGGNAVVNIFSGSMSAPPSANNVTMGFVASSNSFGMLNLLGPDAVFNSIGNGTRVFNVALNTGNRAGVINLNGGVLIANQITVGSAGTPSFLNFNGGAVKAYSANTAFLSGLSAVTLYSGGASIDTTNNNITIGQRLLAPIGNGVTGITPSDGGSNYLGAPVVLISGGTGSNATAIVQVDLQVGSSTYGKVTNIFVTSPGMGYGLSDVLTVTLIGGGGSNASFTTPAIGAVTGGGLTKLGTGILTLTATNTYSGLTTVKNGTLFLTGILTNGGALVENGAHLAGLGAVGGTVELLSGGNLDPGSNGVGAIYVTNLVLRDGSILNLDLGNLTNAGYSDLINVSGNLDITAGNIQVNPNPTNAAGYVLNQAYTLIKYGGTLIGNSDPNTKMVLFGTTYQGYFSNYVAGKAIQVVFTTNNTSGIYWLGDGNTSGGNLWLDSVTGQWTNIVSHMPAVYFDGNPARFTDLSPNTGVNITGTNLPSSMIVEVTNQTYTFQGPGKITGVGVLYVTNAAASLSGGLVINNATNDFTGPVVIKNSTLTLATNTALGSRINDITNNGVLNLKGNNLVINTLNGGGLVDNADIRPVTLTVGNAGGSAAYAGSISNSGGGVLTLIKSGAGTITLGSIGAYAYSGETVITNGTLAFGVSGALSNLVRMEGTTNGPISLDLKGNTVTVNGLQGTYSAYTMGVVTNSAAAPATLKVGAADVSSTFLGQINDNGAANALALTKLGAGSLVLAASNSFSGGTVVSNGMLGVRHQNALGRGPVSLNGGTLVLDTAGLLEGNITNGTAMDITTLNPARTVNLSATRLSTLPADVFGFGPVAGVYRTWVYSGYVNVLTNNTVWTISKAFDDYGYAKLGTNVVMYHGTYTFYATSNTPPLSAGACPIDLRVYNGSGGLGVQGGWPVGLGIDLQGRGVSNSAYFSSFTDPGDGSFLFHDVVVTNAITLNVNSIVSTPSTNGLMVLSGPIGGPGGLTKTGNGRLTFGGINLYSGQTTISNGSLALTGVGSISNSPAINLSFGASLVVTGRTDGTLTLVSGQTLKGNTNTLVNGSVVVGNGATLLPNGALAINNSLTLNGTNIMNISKPGGIPTSDSVTGMTTVAYGGTLIINTNGDPLVAGDSFKLFSAANYGGFPAVLVLPPLDPGLLWDTNRLAFNGTLAVVSNADLAISVPPVNQTVQQCSNATFGVAAYGTIPLSYQWYFGANAIPNATNQSLVLIGVSPANAGAYRVTVTNSSGSLTSDWATLTVIDTIAPAFIVGLTNRAVMPDDTDHLTLPDYRGEVVVADCNPVILIQSPLPGTVVGLGITPVTITATDSSNNVATSTATITVGGSAFPPIRIMPVGDSITYGTGAAGGYRNMLYQLLTNASYNVNFVGTQNGNAAAGWPTFYHEGHSGWRIDQIDSTILADFSAIDEPDILLLLIGTNDYGQGYDTPNATNRLYNLISRIATNRPNIKIVVANLTVRGEPYNTQIQTTFNPMVPIIVAQQAALGRQVYFTDLYSAIPLTDFPDQLHPGQLGYNKMATNWFGNVTNLISTRGTTNQPIVVKAVGASNRTSVVVTFNKPMLPDDATALTNYTLSGGLSILSAAIEPINRRDVTLTTTLQTPNQTYTVTNNNIRDLTTSHLQIAPNSTVTFRAAPTFGVTNNVAESTNFTLIYSLYISNTVGYLNGVPYEYNTAAGVTEFSRVGYYLELQPTNGPLQFIWVSMDPFTNNATKLGVPNAGIGASYQRYVTNMNVVSSVSGIMEGTAMAGGYLEFWPSNYASTNIMLVPGASDTLYDWGDQFTAGTYGCMQIHSISVPQVLLAFNDWGSAGATTDIGIGTSTGANPDWTFANNGSAYSVKRLQVYVLQNDTNPPTLVKASSSFDRTHITVTFSEGLRDDSVNPTNFTLSGGVNILAAALSTNSYEVVLTTTTLDLFSTYTLTVNNVRDRSVNANVIVPNSTVLVTRPFPQITANVPEATNFLVVLGVNLPVTPGTWQTLGTTYSTDNRSMASNFTRVAYYLELATSGGPTNWIYVSMDPFTNNVYKIGVPDYPNGAIFQQKVTNMNVRSSVPGIVQGEGITTGNMEFWPNSYASGTTALIPTGSGTAYDWNDTCTGTTPANGHGSMQIHNYGAGSTGQVLFAISRFNGTLGIGIGNSTNAVNVDWTFSDNAALYTVKNLYVLVQPVAGAGAPSGLVITPSPTNTVEVGSATNFIVSASGTAPLYYLWYQNSNFTAVVSTNIGVTNSAVTCANNGDYYNVIVSNALGTAIAGPVYLKVTDSRLPGFSPAVVATNVTLLQGTNFSRTVGLADNCNLAAFRWYHNTTNLLAGQTTPTLNLTGLKFNDAGAYTLIVSNQHGLSPIGTAAVVTVSYLIESPMVIVAGETFQTTVTAEPNRAYWLEARDSLTEGTWQFIIGVTNVTGPQVLQDAAATGGFKFYRIGSASVP